MQVIPAIISGQHAIRMVWITHRFFEIDYSVERLASSYPFVDGFSLGFFLRREIAFERRAFEGRQRGSKDLEPFFVRPFNHLFHACD